MNKAVFLDRDGTINVEKDYLCKIEEFEFLPGVIEALQALQKAGYLLIIITNQSGIARGYYQENDLRMLNDWMVMTLEDKGIHISGVYYCPHHPSASIEKYRIDCDCRKPKIGLYWKAIKEFDLDVSSCFAIGDKIRDCSICKSTECRGFLIATNEDDNIIQQVKMGDFHNVEYAVDLYDAKNKILCSEGK